MGTCMKPGHPFDRNLQSVLDSEQAYQFLPNGTWMEGGCTLLAMALQRLIPNSQLCSVGRINEGIPDHTVLGARVAGESWFIDYDGLHTAHEMKTKVSQEWQLENPQLELADLDLLEQSNMRWLDYWIHDLAKLLDSELGPIDNERLSPNWFDDEDDEPDLAP